MKHRILALLCALAGAFLCFSAVADEPAGIDFETWFEDATMRVDYFHTGDAREEWISLDWIYRQGIWAGSTVRLIDGFNNGRFYVKLYDKASGTLLFSKGFDSYFGEYQTTDEGLAGIKRTYHETALVPYPRNQVRFVLERRSREGKLGLLFESEIDPKDIKIKRESLVPGVEATVVQKSGCPHRKVDLAFVAVGYTAAEKGKYLVDLGRFTEVFFAQEPYKSRRNRFNVYGVFSPSQESGCDEPQKGIYRNTNIDVTFNSLGSERYVMTEDNRAMRDIAAHVPYDAICLMVHHATYGGGGIYNLYATFIADNEWCDYLLLHEFGHSFAGLGDEYYSSSTAYNDFYPKGIEPTEPNVTALLDPANLRWRQFLTEGIELPTPWEKEKYDELDRVYERDRNALLAKIAELDKEKADPALIEAVRAEIRALGRKNYEDEQKFLRESPYAGKVGAFEGAGYSSTGFYRPMIDCIMFSKGAKPYCRVCEQAVIRIIDHLSE